MSSEEAFTHRVAVALKRRRLVLGWSQTEASRHLRVLPAQLSRWETRFHTPQLQRLWHICKVYGLTPAELLREDEPLLPPAGPPRPSTPSASAPSCARPWPRSSRAAAKEVSHEPPPTTSRQARS